MNNSNIKLISGADALRILLEKITKEEGAATMNDNKEEKTHKCDCTICSISKYCANSKNESEEDKEPVDSRAFSLGEIFSMVMNDMIDSREEEEEEEECSSDEYSFTKMIEEFSEGYTGAFVDKKGDMFKYDQGSKTLLFVTENTTYPAPITASLVNSCFAKKGIFIPNEKALELARKGKTVGFRVDVFGQDVQGHLTMKNNVPSYKIYDTTTNVKPETIILLALMNGIWSI